MLKKKSNIYNKTGLIGRYKQLGKILLTSSFRVKKKDVKKVNNYNLFILTDLLLFQRKKKVNKIKFFRRTKVSNRRSILHINLKYYLELYYHIKQRVVKRRRYKSKWKKRGYYTFSGKKKKVLLRVTKLYWYFWLLRRKKKLAQTWKYYYRKRYFSFNIGFKYRQYVLFFKHRGGSHPYRRHQLYLKRRFQPWRKLKYLINYRRKVFKKEKKKKKLVLYSFRNNLNHWTRRAKFNPTRYKTYLKIKQKQKTYLRIQRRRYQFIFRKLQLMENKKKYLFFNYRPFWFKKGVLVWRMRKFFKKKIYQVRIRQHYLNLLIIKQGLRYYYGNFRLFFLKKIANQLKKKKSTYKLHDFVLYLENSLFMVLYRCNFVSHPKLVIYLMRDNHDIFYVNYQYIHYPLYQVKVGDLVGIKNRILQKMLNRFLRTKKIPAFLYVNYFLGVGWVLRKPEIRDYTFLQVLPLKSLRYLVSNLKYLV